MSAIFCHGDEQLITAENSRDEQQKKTSKKIVTKITRAEKFYDAEECVAFISVLQLIHIHFIFFY